MVWQIQLARQHAAVPLTRDYITEAEWAEPGEALLEAPLLET